MESAWKHGWAKCGQGMLGPPTSGPTATAVYPSPLKIRPRISQVDPRPHLKTLVQAAHRLVGISFKWLLKSIQFQGLCLALSLCQVAEDPRQLEGLAHPILIFHVKQFSDIGPNSVVTCRTVSLPISVAKVWTVTTVTHRKVALHHLIPLEPGGMGARRTSILKAALCEGIIW